MRGILKILTLSVAVTGSTAGIALAQGSKPFFEDRVVINRNTWVVTGEQHSENMAASCQASFQYGENDGSYSVIGRNIETGEVFILVHNTDWSINDAPSEGKVQFNSYSRNGQRVKNGELRVIALDKNTIRLPDLDAGDMYDVLTKASIIRLIMPNNLSNVEIGPLGPALANKMADCFTAAQKELPAVNAPASASDLGPLQKLFDDAQPWDVSVRTQNGLTVKGKFHTIINNVQTAGYDCAIDEQKMPEFVVRCTGHRDGSTQINQNDRWYFTFNKINEKEVQLTRAYAELTGKETSGTEIEGLADLLFRPGDNASRQPQPTPLPRPSAMGRPPKTDVPVMISPGDGDACGSGEIVGLDPKGDGFLSVRSGPGGRPYTEIDRLYNGNQVYVCGKSGAWISVIYTSDKILSSECGVTKSWSTYQAYTGPCRYGWVYSRFVKITAG